MIGVGSSFLAFSFLPLVFMHAPRGLNLLLLLPCPSHITGSSTDKEDVQEQTGCGGDCSSDVARALGISPHDIQSMVCVPVHDARGNVVAVIQAINKVGTGTVPSGKFLRRRNTKNWKDKGTCE